MAVIDFPHDLAILSDVILTQNTPVYSTESLSLIRTARSRGIHRLEGSIIATVEESNIRAFEAFLVQVEGRLNQIKLKLPGRFDSKTAVNATTSVALIPGNTNVGMAGQTGTVSIGDYFTLANDPKIYMAITGGAGTISVFPAIRNDAPFGTGIKFIDVEAELYLTEDAQSINYTETGRICTYQFNFVEALK